MATERYDKRIDRDEDHDYFNQYADIILPLIKGKVLDIGCGQGWLTKQMSTMADSILALDKFTSQPACNKADNIEYRKALIPQDIPYDIYDTIVSTEFVEHITQQDFEIMLDRVYEILDGHFLGSTPCVEQHSGNPYHLREYSRDEFEHLLDRHGFTGEMYQPYPYLLVWDVWRKI